MHYCKLNNIQIYRKQGGYMGELPKLGYVPRLTYYKYRDQVDKFMEYESVHSEWVVFAIEDGSFYFEIEDQHETASFGDLVFCPPGSIFRRVVVSPITLFVFRLSWLDDKGCPLSPELCSHLPVGKISFAHTERLHINYLAMKHHHYEEDRWNMIRMNHYMNDIWMLYCEESKEAMREKTAHHSEDPLIQKAVQLIQKQAFQHISMESVASAIGMSRVSLSKKFRTQLGITPIAYLTNIRLEKAKTLLMETNMTLDQISECCGYQNGFYLNRVFTKHCKLTPMQFRREHRL